VFLEELNKKEIELEKIAHTNEYEIERQNKVIEQISKIDVCPTCKSKITSDHICSIKEEISPKINKLKEGISQSDRELNELYQKREIIKKDLEQIKIEVSKRQTDLFKISEINKLTLQVKAIQKKNLF
jgi:exonuclease SbcC